ncbi:unnamed protein product [Boreogadus saida]
MEPLSAAPGASGGRPSTRQNRSTTPPTLVHQDPQPWSTKTPRAGTPPPQPRSTNTPTLVHQDPQPWSTKTPNPGPPPPQSWSTTTPVLVHHHPSPGPPRPKTWSSENPSAVATTLRVCGVGSTPPPA